MGFEVWQELLLDRLVPSITSTLTGLLVVLLVFSLFRVRNPHTRYLMLHMPLIKGLLVLIRGVPDPVPGTEGRFRFGMQLVDPLSLIPMPSYQVRPVTPRVAVTDLRPAWDSFLLEAVLIVTVVVAVGLLLYRWGGLVLFYHRLMFHPPATRESTPELFRILDRLVPAFGVGYPRVVVVDDPPIAPCTVGVRPPVIVLSSRLLAELDEAQLEAVLAHELAHVARRDGIFHWPSLLLRDLQAFNPVAHKIFDRLLVEREKDSDLRAVRATGRARALAKALVEVALLSRGVNLRPAPGAMTLRSGLMGRTRVVEERVSALLSVQVGNSRLRPLGLMFLFAFMIFVRIYVRFPLAGVVITIE